MPNIAKGVTLQINMPAGSVIKTIGEGIAVISPSTQLAGLTGAGSIGPFAESKSIILTANSDNFSFVLVPETIIQPQFITDDFGNVTGVGPMFGGSEIERRPEWKKDNFRKKRYSVNDDMSAAVSGTARWTRFSGTSVLANSKDYVKSDLGCNNSLKLTGLSSFERIQAPLQAPIVPSAGVVMLHLYITEMPVDYSPVPPAQPIYQNGSVQLLLSTDSGFATTVASSFVMTASQFIRSGWNGLQISAADDGTLNTTGTPAWTYSGTAPGDANTSYTHARVTITSMQPLAGTTPIVYVGGIFQGGKGQAAVLMNFDDCHQDSIDLSNLYRSYEIPVSLGVVTGVVGQGSQMSESQLRQQYDMGADLFAHTTDHAVLDTLTPAAAAAEMSQSRDWLISRGFVRTAEVFAFPQNQANDHLFASAKASGYRVARWSKPGWLPTGQGIDNPLSIGSRDLGGKTLAQAKKMLDSAEAYNCVQIVYGHQINTKAVQAMTYSGGVVTVSSTGHGYANGNTVNHRGADQAEYNVAGIVEGATTNTYTFKATMTSSAATSASGMRSFSADTPAAGSAAPASSLYWNWSDHIAFCKDIADRSTAGTLTAINFSTLLDRCRI